MIEMIPKEIYDRRRSNFVEKTQNYFQFLETEFGFNKPIHLFFKQPNGVITSDRIEYENDRLKKKITISNSYHPIDYGFEINLTDLEINDTEMLFYLLKENQDVEQEYLKGYAERLNELCKIKLNI
jgi:hypothetical protein